MWVSVISAVTMWLNWEVKATSERPPGSAFREMNLPKSCSIFPSRLGDKSAQHRSGHFVTWGTLHPAGDIGGKGGMEQESQGLGNGIPPKTVTLSRSRSSTGDRASARGVTAGVPASAAAPMMRSENPSSFTAEALHCLRPCRNAGALHGAMPIPTCAHPRHCRSRTGYLLSQSIISRGLFQAAVQRVKRNYSQRRNIRRALHRPSL